MNYVLEAIVDPMSNVLSALFWTLLTSGAAATAAYFLFQKFSANWLDNKFARKLEAFRHEQAKELAHFNAEIDGALSAKIRLQEKQFDIIIDTWGKLTETKDNLATCVSPLQQYAELRSMTPHQREEYLKETDFPPWLQNKILTASDVQKEFNSAVDRKKFYKATSTFADLRQTVFSTQLFWEETTYKQLENIITLANSCLIDKEMHLDGDGNNFGNDARKGFSDELVPAIDILVADLRSQLGNKITNPDT